MMFSQQILKTLLFHCSTKIKTKSYSMLFGKKYDFLKNKTILLFFYQVICILSESNKIFKKLKRRYKSAFGI